MRKSAPSLSSFSRILLLAVFFAASLAAARAQDAQEKPRAELSEDVRDKLQELQPLEAQQNWDAALALVDSLLATAGPNTFDRAVLSQIKANYLFKKKQPLAAIEPLETALKLSEANGFFDAKATENLRYYVANLYFELGATTVELASTRDKDDPDAQRADREKGRPDYEKARAYIEKWLQVIKTDPSSAPSSSDTVTNAEVFYASLLFSMAELDPDHVDLSLIKLALAEIETSLHSIARPPESFYVIELAALQRLKNYASAADVLEHILKAKLENSKTKPEDIKTYWQQLVAFYMTMASDAEKNRDDQAARQYNVRSILSIERAQQNGALNSPDDNFTLVGLYFNVGQYGQAAELLENGLHNQAIKSTQDHWILLANTYQELHKEMKAVDTLREAATVFPANGEFDYLAAQILYDLNKTTDALAAIQSCVAKDGGKQPGQSWLFLSYLAYELQNYELTKQAAEKALKYPDVDTVKAGSLRDAAESALQRREATLHN